MIYFNWYGLMIPACIVYIFFFGIGIGSAYFAFVTEILPPIGVGICMTTQWICVAIVGKFVPILKDSIGILPLCTFFCFVCIIGFLLLDWLVIESKGKNQEQIIEEYKTLPY